MENEYYMYPEAIEEEKVDIITKALQYYPPDTEIFSLTGCKRIPEKVAYVMDNEDDDDDD